MRNDTNGLRDTASIGMPQYCPDMVKQYNNHYQFTFTRRRMLHLKLISAY